MNGKTTKLLMTLLIATSCSAGISAPEKTTDRTGKIAAVRILAAGAPGIVLKDWMTQGAWNRWNEVCGAMIRTDGKSAMISDFFNHAILLTGPQNEQSGICAFYNPLQDNILLLQTDNMDRMPKIENFVFMTGTEFRSETLKDKEYPQAIAPVKGNLDQVLLQNIAAVSDIFRKAFPDSLKTFSLNAYRKFGTSADNVAANASLRLALLKKFTLPDAKEDAEKAGEIALLLWNGGKAELKTGFTFPADAEDQMVSTYAGLPEMVRKSMLPALYFRNKTGMLLAFSSRLLPEVLILTKTGTDAKEKTMFVFLPLTEKFAESMKDVK